MKSITSTILAALSLAASTSAFETSYGSMPMDVEALDKRGLKSMTSMGCFNSSTGMSENGTYTYNTSGLCQGICVELDNSVLALSNSDECWCGDTMPPLENLQATNASCNDPCAGYDKDMCGGLGFYTVYLTGTEDISQVKYATATASSTSTSSSATSASETTNKAGATVTVSAVADSASSSAASSGSSPSIVGIAVGVVVGVLVIAAIAGGMFFYMRNRNRRAVEEEYRKNAAMNYGGGKTHSHTASSFTDTRLDPVLANRRMSDGSIADNEDYSRRILKVTNA